MKIVPTRRTDYALRSLIYLAEHPDDRINAAEIGTEMDVPLPILHQVLAELQRAGLVTSLSGPRGGYLIARNPEQLTILEILETMEGPIRQGECALRGGPCHWDEVCAVHPAWSEAREEFASALASHTLAEVTEMDLRLRHGTAEIPESSHRR
ncbi:MAG: RrF2 family transcriptional regulator [Acidimicrobiia bacterium]